MEVRARYAGWGVAVLLLIYAGAVFTLSPFAGPLLMGAVLAAVGWPWQLRLERRFRMPRWLASLVHASAWVAVIVLPAVVIVDLTGPRLAALFKRWQSGAPLVEVPPEVSQIPLVGHWAAAHLAQLNGQVLTDFLSHHSELVTNWLGQFWIFSLHTLFAALTVFALSLHGESIGDALRLLTAQLWAGEAGNRFLRACRDAARSVLLGLIGVGVVEGIFIGIAYAFAGLSMWPLWLTATALISPVPFGASAVVGAATIWLALTGHWLAGILVLGWGLIVITIADLFVRPVITGSHAEAPFFLVFFGVLGGAEAFGMIGLILGPMLVLLAFAVWRAWEQRIRLREPG